MLWLRSFHFLVQFALFSAILFVFVLLAGFWLHCSLCIDCLLLRGIALLISIHHHSSSHFVCIDFDPMTFITCFDLFPEMPAVMPRGDSSQYLLFLSSSFASMKFLLVHSNQYHPFISCFQNAAALLISLISDIH